MEIDQIRAFISLAQTKNFSRTAENLHIVQSGISSRIKGLEGFLEQALFRRSNRSVSVTVAGETFLPYAERILELVEEATFKLRGLSHCEDRFAVGSTDSLWQFFLHDVLMEFSNLYPKVAVVAKAGHSWEVAEFLQDGVIDLGIVYERPSSPGIETRLVYEDDVILVASPRNRQVPKRREITRADLPQLPLLTVSWRGEFQAWTESILPEKYQAAFSPDQLTLLIAYLLQGRGAAFVPQRTIARELSSGKLRRLPTAKDLRAPSRKVFAISRKAGWQRSVVKSWMTLMKKHGFI